MNIKKPLLVLVLLLPLVTGFLIMSRDKEVRLEKRVLYDFPVNDRIRLEVLITAESNVIVNLAEKDSRYEDGQLIFNLQYEATNNGMTAGFVFNRETNLGTYQGLTLDFNKGKLAYTGYTTKESETNETIYVNREGGFLPTYVLRRPGGARRESIRYEFVPYPGTNAPPK